MAVVQAGSCSFNLTPRLGTSICFRCGPSKKKKKKKKSQKEKRNLLFERQLRKIERKDTDWEKILSKHVYDKRFVSRIYKQFLQLNNKNINSTIDNSKKINWTDIPPTKIYEMQIST